jgi:flavin-dependent dehydrogenase
MGICMSLGVLIVGAGPVGLFTAIEAKLHNPDLEIKVLERNEEYSRHHILRLEKESLVNSLVYQQYPAVRVLNGFVPTSDIESTFLEIAQNLGIVIERGIKVADSNSLLKQYPSAHTLIGADGAHSVIRKQIFKDEKKIDTNLQYIVELKYKAKNKTSRLPVATYGPALGQVPYLLTENVGKEKNGETPVSLFIFVDEPTYNEIREQKGLQLSNLKPSSKRKTKLLNTIRPWLSLRKEALDEEMILGSEQINGVALNIFQSASFAKNHDGRNVYLVGDAAAGVPYFRALNAGLLAAAITAKTIALNTEPDLENLNALLTHLMNGEIKRAKKQNGKVNIGRAVNYVLANVSKIATGALLKPEEEAAMLNARIEKTSIIRRHPRILLACSLGLFALVVLACTTMPFLSIGAACFISITGAVSLACISALLVKMTLFISQCFKGAQDIRHAPPLPWETHNISSSFKALSQLSVDSGNVNSNDASVENEIEHYPSPLITLTQGELPQEIYSNLPSCA